jgi:hypothetical protein
MKIGEVYGGKFLKSDNEGRIDIPSKPYDMVVTIKGTDLTEFKPDKAGDEPRRQVTLSFHEIKDLEFGCNATNARAIALIAGSDDTDDWLGKKIELFTIPEERSATGHAIRVRKPRKATAETPVVGRFGPAAAAKLTNRLVESKREVGGLRTFLAQKFPQYESALAGDPAVWPSECGTAVAEWFAKPEPSPIGGGMPEEDIPFHHGAFDI